MSTTKVANIVQTKMYPEAINIVYERHNSAFDLILKTLDYRFIENINTNDNSWYNLWMSNDPINFSQNNIEKCSDMHIHNLLFFHNSVPSQFKKEDVLILKKHIVNSYKILLSSDLTKSWLPSDNKWFNIDYGIPFIPSDTSNRENIVILNFNNNDNITAIYNNIKSQLDNVIMLNSLPQNLEKLYETLHSAKICIDFENIVNSLCAAMCGCFCLTTYDNEHLFYYKKIVSLNNLYSDLVALNSSNINVDHVVDQQNQLAEKFSFDIFTQRISMLIKSVMKDKYIL